MTALMGKKAQDAIGLAKTNEFPPQLTVCCHKVGSTENGVAYHDPGLVTSDWCLQEEHEWRKLLFIKGRGCIQFAKSFKVTLAFIIETVVRCANANEISFDLNNKKKTLPNQGSWIAFVNVSVVLVFQSIAVHSRGLPKTVLRKGVF